MSVLKRLLDFLPTYFNVDPMVKYALALSYSDPAAGMTFTVKDGVISARIFGKYTADFEITLEGRTIGEVATAIDAVFGYAASSPAAMTNVSALALIEVENSSEDWAYAYTNPLFAFFDPIANELRQAEEAGYEMLRHLSIPSATGLALDYWGEYFNIARSTGETDIDYGQRIINEIRLPKSNNIAMEMILERFYGYEIEVKDLNQVYGTMMWMNNSSTPVHNASYPIFDSDLISVERAAFGLFFPNGTYVGWTSEQKAELKILVYRIKAAGYRPKVFWKDSGSYSSEYL